MSTDWITAKLGDYSEIILGGTPKTIEPAYWNGDIPWVSVVDFDVEKHIYKTEKTITEKGLNESNTELLNVSDIIISARGTVGKTVVCGIPMAFNQSCYAIRSKSNDLDQDFLYYLLNYYVTQLQKKATGGVFDTIITDTLKKLEIILPPLSTQHKITGIISVYDDLIENNEHRVAILEEMAQRIYKEWFVDFKYTGHENDEHIDTEMGIIPENWEVVEVSNLLKRLKAGNKYTQKNVSIIGEIPVIDQSAKEVLGFHNNEPDHLANPNNPIIIFGDHTCKMQSMVEPFSVGPNVIPFISNVELPIHFLFYLVNSLVETREYKRHWNDLINKKVVCTTKNLANQFTIIVTPIFQQINGIRKINNNLRQTRDLLLPILISGQKDVSALNIDFGTSV